MSDTTPQPARKDTAGDPQLVGEFLGTPEGGRPSNNLPLQLSSFIGRGREIAEVEKLLKEHRLLTLTGPGGSGKTRLALAVASRVLDEFDDGVWLVELAALSDPDLVPQAVASVVGVREAPGSPLLEALADHLVSRTTLVVLDNCEHLVGACADLAEALLSRCPNLSILATSREALGVSGEILFVVPLLSLPDPRHLKDLEGLSRYEAARLFSERARAVRPDFEITERNAYALAQICYRLDGMPLAIELAAARARVLSVEQISDRLEDSFALLSGGRGALPHHRTLRATMDWSYGLLSEEERVLFRRLSVFAGGFTLTAAEAVRSGDGLEGDELLNLLSALVDKSLVLVSERDGEARYRLLETIRQYAAEKLEEAGEGTEVRRRHADFFLQLAEQADTESKGARQAAWLGRLEAELDNLRAVLDRALENGEADLGLRVAGSLGGFWLVRGHLSEGRRWLEAALEGGVGAPESARTRVLLRAGLIAREQGDHEQSVELLGEALALARKLGDKATAAIALLNLGWAALLRDELQRAAELTEESLTLQCETNDEVGVARALTVLGLLANAQGNHERAMALHEESLGLAREAGDVGAIALSLMAGALASLGRGDRRRARELCEEGLESSWRLKMVHPTASHLQIAASVAGSHGQPVRSARLWGAAEESLKAIGLELAPLERRFYEPYIAAARSRLGAVAFEAAWAEGRKMTTREAVEYALVTEDFASSPEDAAPSLLSERETEVLRLVAEGLTDAQVAQRLYVSRRTVGHHLSAIYRKMGVPSRAAATKAAVERGLI